MCVRRWNTLFKLLQRQTYSCLSTKYGIWFCLTGIIVVIISALHFGEITLEWSMQKYSQKFNKYYDNIARKSFQDRLCLPEPIDIVYTWVNGSDDKLIEQLKEVKKAFLAKLNETLGKPGKQAETALKNKKPMSKPEDKFKWKTNGTCPFPNCAPFPGVAIIGLPKNVTIYQLEKSNKLLSGGMFLNFQSPVDPSIKFIQYNNEEDLRRLRNKTIDFIGKQLHFTYLFITSTVKIDHQKLDSYAMIHDVPLTVSKSDLKQSLNAFNLKVSDIELYSNSALITFTTPEEGKKAFKLAKTGLNIRGKKFKLFKTTLVWKPLSKLELGLEKYHEDISSSRFADNEELKYSLRSVEKFAPWVRNIYIVTNGQIPSWLNLEHPRIKVVTHEEIFINKSHLPTFSSPAIEVHIHRIKGLSKKFIYLNDDVFFGDHVWPDDFFTHAKGHKIYLTWPVPNCNEGCPATWINDKYCDKACNVSECDWDGGDCLGPQGKQKWQFGQGWHGQAYSAIGEYCNGGCANNWIGDRYCDINCNVLNCGFDAGDCGLLNFYQLFSTTLSEKTKLITVPAGVKAFYINLTDIFQHGLVKEADYAEFSVIRTGIISKRFKLLSVSLYANFSSVSIPFHISGFRDINQTQKVELNFNISVNTAGTMKTTTIPPTVQKPVILSKKKILYPTKVYDISKDKAHLIYYNASRQNWKATKSVHDIPSISKNVSLSQEVQSKIDLLIKKLEDGDITQKGYNRSIAEILKKFMDKKSEMVGRHLLALTENLGNIESDVSKHSGKDLLQAHKDKKGSSLQRRNIHIVSDTEGMISVDEKLSRTRNWKRTHVQEAVLDSKQRWEHRYGQWNPLRDTFATSPFPWERHETFKDLLRLHREMKIIKTYETRKPRRALLDTFANSLLHVSRIYNRAFGYQARKVPAHMPHFIDKEIVSEIQRTFWHHFNETSSHKIRRADDMQFAFSYNYYLFGVPAVLNVTAVFHELDTDHSGALSDRELRTMTSRLYSLPLDLKTTETMESTLKNCSKNMNHSRISKEKIIKESYFDPKMPLVTEDFLQNCPPILTELNSTMKGKTKYKFETLGDEDVTFKMIRNNVSYLIFQLDWIRKNKRKFVCLNDNIDHTKPDAEIIRTVLKDFFESMFPVPSQFELSSKYRNKFLYIDELRAWKESSKRHDYKSGLVYVIPVLILVLFILKRKVSYCIRKLWYICSECFKIGKTKNSRQTKLYTI